MARINFGGVMEDVITSKEFPLKKAQKILKNETVAILGYYDPVLHDFINPRLPPRPGWPIYIAEDAQLAQVLSRRGPGEVGSAHVGSLLSRMIHCYKPGCRFCEKGKGRGHGPIWILSVSQGNRRVRQITIPAEWKEEIAASLRRYAEIQKLLKQIALVNQQLLEERKKR